MIPQNFIWEEDKVTMVAGVRRSKSSVSVSQDAVFNHSIVALQQEPTYRLIVSQPIWREGGHCDTHPFCIALPIVTPLHCIVQTSDLSVNQIIKLVLLSWSP